MACSVNVVPSMSADSSSPSSWGPRVLSTKTSTPVTFRVCVSTAATFISRFGSFTGSKVRAALVSDTFPRFEITRSVNSVVETGFPKPLMSPVRAPLSSVTSTACSMSPAAFPSPRCRSIIAALRMMAVGLAMFFPAMSGAEPCTASKIATSLPMFADGAKPRPPVRPDVRSLRMSPFMLLVTITSNCSGRIAS